MEQDVINFIVPAGVRGVIVSFAESGMDLADYDVRLITTDPTPGKPERLAELRIVEKGNGNG